MKTVIEPGKYPVFSRLKEAAASGYLLRMLAYRDFKVRYAQTFLGVTWVLIQPLLTLLIFTLVFSKAIHMDTGGIPYPVYTLTGMIAWSYFSYVIGQAGQSVIQSQALVTKVYFPRLVIPLSKSLVGLIDFFVTLLFTLVLMAIYGVPLSSYVFMLPVFLIGTLLFSLSIGILFSALTIRYRDLQYTIPFILQLGIYLAPVAYPAQLIPAEYQVYYYLNPVAGLIDGFRWSLLGVPPVRPDLLWLDGGIILVLFAVSLYYFVRVENTIADIL